MSVYSGEVFNPEVFLTDEDASLAGTSAIALTSMGALSTVINLAGASTIALTGSASLTTAIQMVGSALIALTLADAALKFRGNARRLDICGHPTMALENFKGPNPC
jgi:hypothetical protein